MQPIFRDAAYKRNNAPKQWAQQAQTTPDSHEEQEDQWAILQYEAVEEEDMQQKDLMRSGWDQRDTDGSTTISSSSSFDELPQDFEDDEESNPNHVDILVAGIGGGGMNAISRMIHTRVRGVRFVAMNTDAQVLVRSETVDRICLGQHQTKGLGAGGNAAIGMRAATESTSDIQAVLGNANMVFIAAGMGGGTGTGAAPVVASLAKKLGALTVGIVTLPFTFEGMRRRRIAEQGLADLATEVDALITIPNDRLLTTVARECNLADAFKVADDVLRQGVQGLAEVINVPGMINVDFADVRSTLHEAGTALMSIGHGEGPNRAQIAAEEAIAGGFLNVTIRGAKRVLFNISGGEDMTLFEVNEVAERIGAAIDSVADITFGAVIDPTLDDAIRVTLIAAGMEDALSGQVASARRNARSFAGAAPAIQSPLTPRAKPLGGGGSRNMVQRKEGLQHNDEQAIDVPPFIKRRRE
ncbi:MAG TPA: cell division protein FtsZ [Ktedonobacteraceae bacterium]|jgi:cell division protein FtsZ|nr:cell division protein FtsZ [Ktedonobacteraceae bacterium]